MTGAEITVDAAVGHGFPPATDVNFRLWGC
jgi:hypothetical protein